MSWLTFMWKLGVFWLVLLTALFIHALLRHWANRRKWRAGYKWDWETFLHYDSVGLLYKDVRTIGFWAMVIGYSGYGVFWWFTV